jgi:alcohol dehydrogenase
VLVPHPRYLIDHGSLSASLAGAYMCSGLTAFAALKRLTEHAKRGPVLLVGMGGVGMMGLSFALALFPHKPIVADIDPAKRDAALAAGAAAAYDPADPNARKMLLKATGGVAGAVDFAGTDGSLSFATGSIARGAKVVITGLMGGSFAMPIAMFPIKAISIEGTMTGTLAEAQEMMALARAGKIPPVPIHERPLSAAQASLDDLRGGKVVGRVVLVP